MGCVNYMLVVPVRVEIVSLLILLSLLGAAWEPAFCLDSINLPCDQLAKSPLPRVIAFVEKICSESAS